MKSIPGRGLFRTLEWDRNELAAWERKNWQFFVVVMDGEDNKIESAVGFLWGLGL